MDRIEQIKAEIERLKSKLFYGLGLRSRPESSCKCEAYNEILSIIDSLPKGGTENQEKVYQASEDLEQAAQEYEHNLGYYECMNQWPSVAFKAGAQWQKEQMEERWLKDREGCFWDGVEEGKKAMKEQMMKGGIEGIVRKTHQRISIRYTNKNGIFDYFYCQSGDFKVGDKVKIIVVKEG